MNEDEVQQDNLVGTMRDLEKHLDDALVKAVDRSRIFPSRELSLAITNLEQALMWVQREGFSPVQRGK
jgi:hypothetical protein